MSMLMVGVGRVFEDHQFQENTQLATLQNTLMIKQDATGKTGCMFMKIKLFGNNAINFNKYVEKDDNVYIVGKLKQEEWEYQGKPMKKQYISVSEFLLLGNSKNVVNNTRSDFTREQMGKKNTNYNKEDDENLNFGEDTLSPTQLAQLSENNPIDDIPF